MTVLCQGDAVCCAHRLSLLANGKAFVGFGGSASRAVITASGGLVPPLEITFSDMTAALELGEGGGPNKARRVLE